jgi:hypothetical protein
MDIPCVEVVEGVRIFFGRMGLALFVGGRNIPVTQLGSQNLSLREREKITLEGFIQN